MKRPQVAEILRIYADPCNLFSVPIVQYCKDAVNLPQISTDLYPISNLWSVNGPQSWSRSVCTMHEYKHVCKKMSHGHYVVHCNHLTTDLISGITSLVIYQEIVDINTFCIYFLLENHIMNI